MPRKALAAMFVATAWLSPLIVPSVRAEPVPSEGAIKVAFVFNFLKFIQWPAGAFGDTTEAVSVCVRGGSDLDGPLDALKNKLVQDRPIQVHRVAAGGASGRCHVVYFGAQPVSPGELGQKHTVTIGDAPHFAEAGGIVNFFREGERLRFEVNIEAARRAEVQFSADMLRLARIVDGGPTQ